MTFYNFTHTLLKEDNLLYAHPSTPEAKTHHDGPISALLLSLPPTSATAPLLIESPDMPEPILVVPHLGGYINLGFMSNILNREIEPKEILANSEDERF